MHVSICVGALLASSTAAWNMEPVRSIQARVQGDTPVWNSTNNAYVSAFGSTFNDQYTAVLDTVNLASVEGVLKYVQSECIASPTDQCQRKNKVKNIVFYDITFAQPNATLAAFGTNTNVYPEYGPYLAMDSGACTATSGSTLPTECLEYNGLNGTINLGSFVGGVPSTADARALYPNTIWFSYPNSCVHQPWSKKTPACRQQFTGGLCPFGTKPDGISCTFSYTILGYISLDDLVGITKLNNTATGKPFKDFNEFCLAKKVEFNATTATNGSFVDVKSDLTFWDNPNDVDANAARAKVVVDLYTANIKTPMTALPSIDSLTASNPPCYKNSRRCYDAQFGCRRKLYAQVCEVCTSAASDCVVKDPSYTFPTLVVPTLPPTIAPVNTSAPGSLGATSSPEGAATTTPKANSGASSMVFSTTLAEPSLPYSSSSIFNLHCITAMRLAFATGVASLLAPANAWSMEPVRAIQARAEGDTPVWDSTYNTYVSPYGSTSASKYTAVLDTVNLASVEGVLKYIQSECINAANLQLCQRKNSVVNIVFYDITIVQPNASIAQFGTDTDVYPEYGPYVAMDSGACTATIGSSLPVECLEYNGLNGTANFGPFVGGVPVSTDNRALYPNTIWYSYPNSCVQEPWSSKTDACRAKFIGGLCPFGTKPDGVNCTFSYKILGWVALDDVVGITNMTNPATNQKFANYSQFCNAKLVEFSATLLSNNSWGNFQSNLTFWDNPNSEVANIARANAVVSTYTSKMSGNMTALPSIASLTTANPPCYRNFKKCYDAPYGCRRVLYGQVCEVCNTSASDCVVKNSTYVFPTLALATVPPTTATATGTNIAGSSTASGSTKGGNSTPKSQASNVSGVGAVLFDIVVSALAFGLPIQAWNMEPVRVIQARAQGDTPLWDSANNVFVSAYGSTFSAKYTAVMDTVNLASVEGVLKYIQSECINAPNLQLCKRKNSVTNIVFYDITIAQTNATLAQFQTNTAVFPEYGPYLAMDSGQCTPTTGTTLATECLEYNGLNGTINLGPFVGGVPVTTDNRALYPNTIWYSYPNSCVQKQWSAKTAECRDLFTGGLCPFGTKPDGIKCTYSYKILGWVSLDDVVGITNLTNPNTNTLFANYSQFCSANLTEFSATLLPNNSWANVQSNLTFWANPNDESANVARANAVVSTYAANLKANMVALPSVATLTAANPPCYKNSKQCYDAKFGCRRKLYAQVCEVCTEAADDCVVKDPSYVFPTVIAPTLSPSATTSSPSTIKPGTAGGSNAPTLQSLSLTALMSSIVITMRVFVLASIAASATAWNMQPVRSIQARAQGDTPVWDATNGAYVSAYGKTFQDQYQAVMDSVNFASIEGVLKYIQSECINAPNLQLCQRKNQVKNIVFYDIWIAQPNNSIAQFETNTDVYPEYGPFVAMDSGACTPAGTSLPLPCLQYNGLNGTVNLGPFVGGVPQNTDARALYPGTIWFSYPNSCVQQPWSKKTAACRQTFTGGLCPLGVKPDGVKCTFSYTILGYLALDDLVGITSMTNPDTNEKFANYSQFCNAKLTEFSATLLPNNSWADVKSDLTFWTNPNDPAANQARSAAVVSTYAAKKSSPMTAIPTIADLTAANPPCYKNSKICYDAEFGCRRTLYAQVCEVCTSAADGCVVKDPSYTFPTLTLPTLPPTTTTPEATAAGSAAGTKVNNTSPQASDATISNVYTAAALATAAIALAH
ncbi:hypothetical protein THRCLA_20337 [Thraustotheca clavata]|uniref:Secreted protein n=1 Tax=Thraustotheca clavata TaxID=74557 RepID=A0A1W0A8J4_9STRA|nr:hypothetical protein THRCLA_20337 [Thraustotheca clavata]